MGRAIVRSPQVFLMDEPLSNLDAKLRVSTRTQIAALQTRLGVTTVYVTHDQVEAMTMGDRVAVLKRGVLQQVDAPQTLYDSPDNIFVAGFIGSPSMNIAEADLTRENGTTIANVGSMRLPVPDAIAQHYPRVPDYIGKKVAIGMRPEHFVRSSDGAARMRVKVDLVEALGSDVLVHFTSDSRPIVTEDMREAVDDADAFAELERRAREGGQSFTARIEPKNVPKLGEEIELGFRGEELHFFDLENGRALR
jgi:multiple sugar transport system ATP-binding protein